MLNNSEFTHSKLSIPITARVNRLSSLGRLLLARARDRLGHAGPVNSLPGCRLAPALPPKDRRPHSNSDSAPPSTRCLEHHILRPQTQSTFGFGQLYVAPNATQTSRREHTSLSYKPPRDIVDRSISTDFIPAMSSDE